MKPSRTATPEMHRQPAVAAPVPCTPRRTHQHGQPPHLPAGRRPGTAGRPAGKQPWHPRGSHTHAGRKPLSLDTDRGRLRQIGAFRPDTGERFESPRFRKAADLQAALAELERLTLGATHVMGHNLVAHDLPILQQAAPWLGLHRLPVIDTLRLSPIAFPQNPYHRLIKNHKLISSAQNSPLADCLACWTLFQDQCVALQTLKDQAPQEAAVCEHLFGPLPG